jgi:hypothetical protein
VEDRIEAKTRTKFSLVMGRKSKASLARLANLPKAPQKSFKASVEDVAEFNSDSEDTDFIPFRNHTSSEDDEGEQRLGRIRGQFYFLADDFSDDDDDMTDLESVSDSDPEDRELEDEEEDEVRDDAALLNFAAVLKRAQEIAAEAERQNQGERKRPHQYTGNSKRTVRRHAEKRRKLAASGQKSITDWTEIQKRLRQPQSVQTSPFINTPKSVS